MVSLFIIHYPFHLVKAMVFLVVMRVCESWAIKKCKNAKWLSEEALQIAVKRREAKGKGEKECRVPRNSKER